VKNARFRSLTKDRTIPHLNGPTVKTVLYPAAQVFPASVGLTPVPASARRGLFNRCSGVPLPSWIPPMNGTVLPLQTQDKFHGNGLDNGTSIPKIAERPISSHGRSMGAELRPAEGCFLVPRIVMRVSISNWAVCARCHPINPSPRPRRCF